MRTPEPANVNEGLLSQFIPNQLNCPTFYFLLPCSRILKEHADGQPNYG